MTAKNNNIRGLQLSSVENAVVKTLPHGQIKVLAMKLQLPYLPVQHIKRESICRALDQGSKDCKLRLLIAAPGYGKSLALTEWLLSQRQQGKAVAWLSLDPKENDIKRFLLYLFSSVNSVLPNVGVEALKRIDDDVSPETVFNLWVQELQEIEQTLIIALDDCHHIHSPDVMNILDDMVNYLPSQVSLACTSRQAWSLNTARLASQNKLIELHEHDLALNDAEIKDWLKLKGKVNVGEQGIEQVSRWSSGWMTGLNLLIQIFPDLDGLHLRGNEPRLNDYLEQEWHVLLNDEERKFCQQLAVLGQASATFMDTVYERSDSQNLLTTLSRRHILITRNSDQANWYTIHPMIAASLQLTLNQSELNGIYLKACNWFAAEGDVIQAVEMALRSGNKAKAAELVQATAESILGEQDIAQLLSWKEQLPLEVIAASPRLVIIFSWALAFAQQLDEAERLMAQIDKFLPITRQAGNDEVPGQLFAIRGYIARVRGNIDNAIQLCEQALEKLPKHKYIARAVTYFNLSNACMTTENLSRAREYNRLSYECARAAGSVHLEMLALHEHARIEQVKGHLTLADKLVAEGIRLSDQLRQKESAAAYGRLVIYRGYLAWLRNDICSAEQDLKLGLRIAERCHDAYIIMAGILLSNVARQQGQLEKAFDHLTRTEAQLQRWRVPGMVYQPWLSTVRTNLLIDQAKLENAMANLDSLYALGHQNPYILCPEHYPNLKGLIDVFYVRAKAFSGDHKDALKMLDDQLSGESLNQQGFRLTFIYLMRALIRFQIGQEDDAIQDFKQSLTLAERENCLMPFIEYSSGLASLYNKLPQQIKQRPFVESILQHIDIAEDEGANRAFVQVKALISQREMGVLKLIAQGFTNQDIADRLFISLHTVKTHARRINAKLGVKSRTQAIIKAKEIGLF